MCDTMVTLSDHGVLFAKNSDRDPNEAQVVEFHAGGQHPSGQVRVTHAEVPQVPRTYDVLISRPWWMWGAEIGANEHGVVIGNEAVFTRRVGRRDGVLLGMDLLRLALERARDRREAVEVIVGLLEEYGQGGSCSHEHPRFTYDNSFIVADAEGAVVLETAGRHHATEEVRRARSISNGLTIPDFAKHHADPVRGRVAQCAARRSRTQASAEGAAGPLDLMAALRDHGGPQVPRYSPVNGALAAPCAHAGGVVTSTQSTASWVAAPGEGRHWVTATSAPCTSIFKPLAVGPVPTAEAPPASADPIRNVSDPRFLWWRHEQIHRRWLRDEGDFAAARATRGDLERSWVQPGVNVGQAWIDAADWEESALAAVTRTDASGADRRPSWVRRLWRTWNQQAGVEA